MQMTTKEETVVIGFKSELNEAKIEKHAENWVETLKAHRDTNFRNVWLVSDAAPW